MYEDGAETGAHRRDGSILEVQADAAEREAPPGAEHSGDVGGEIEAWRHPESDGESADGEQGDKLGREPLRPILLRETRRFAKQRERLIARQVNELGHGVEEDGGEDAGNGKQSGCQQLQGEGRQPEGEEDADDLAEAAAKGAANVRKRQLGPPVDQGLDEGQVPPEQKGFDDAQQQADARRHEERDGDKAPNELDGEKHGDGPAAARQGAQGLNAGFAYDAPGGDDGGHGSQLADRTPGGRPPRACGFPRPLWVGLDPGSVLVSTAGCVLNRAGPFEILEVLGEGSFGTVCVARVINDPLKRRVALKILKGAYITNKKILNRTRDEARLLSRINHPNIVRVEKLMEVNARPIVVMEHVQGVSLDQILYRYRDGLPPAIALEMARQTCIALHVAYQEALGEDGRPMRVIHRDIKPSNVLASIHGEIKVVDFGIAKGEFEGREAQTESVVMGSRPYMAPERLDGLNDSPSVDVYSVGMSLYELLTGRTMNLSINPVNHEAALNRQLSYIQVAGMSPSALEDLRDLIRRMCAYTRDYRPSAIECARELEQLLFAIEPRYRIGLEEFCRTTVLPIYESRQARMPTGDEAAPAGESSEDNAIAEVTGAFARPAPVAPQGARWLPLAGFVGLLALLVGGLGVAAVLKFVRDADGEGEVKLWVPQGAKGRVGDILVPGPGTYALPEGPTTLGVTLADGRQLQCRFDAYDGTAVRFVSDHEISVDDGGAIPCTTPNP